MPKNNKSSLITNSLIYTLGGIVTKCFAFFLLPLYTAYLSPSDYGVTSIVTTFLCISSFVVSFSTYSAVLRFYVDYKDDSNKLGTFYGSVFFLILISGILWGVLLFLLQNLLVDYVFVGINFYPIVFACIISMIFNCTHTFFETILRSQQKANKATILSVLYFLANAFFTIIFVVYYSMGAYGVVLATLISGLLYTVYMLVYMLSHGLLILKINKNIIVNTLKYSIPLMPHNISPHFALMVQKILISDYCSLALLGIYTVAAQFGTLADTVQTYVNQAYGPWLFERLSSSNINKKEIGDNTCLLMRLLGGIFLIISLFAQDYIIFFIDKQYVEAWKYVPFIVLIFAIKTIYYFYVNILFYHKQAARILFVATLTSNIVSVILAYLLIPYIGIIGAIIVDFVTMSVQLCLIIRIAKRYEDIGLKIPPMIQNIIIMTCFMIIGFLPSIILSEDFSLMIKLLLKLLVVFLYFTIILLNYRMLLKSYFKYIINR